MKVEVLQAGLLGTNCYILINEDTKECIVVDPGGDGDKIAETLLNDDLKMVAILLTHGHCDHAGGLEDLKKKNPDAVSYALDLEKETLSDYKINMSRDVGYGKQSYSVDEYLEDGKNYTIAGMSFTVFSTPGHTKGGCCYYFKEDNILVSGDVLFKGSVGRSDFPGGSFDELIDSIKTKLFVLPDDTVVLPGHMAATTIGYEKENNMFVR